MSPDEAVRLLAVARASFPGMSIVEGQGTIWHKALGDLTFPECCDAIVEHAKVSSQIVDIHEIRARVTSARRALAGEERQQEIESRRPSSSQELVPMPDWFWPTARESQRRARAARKQAEEAGEPVTFGSHILSALDGMRKPSGGAQW